MRQTYRILPVYSGDVSGVCSALYELGGMVVMHDPSGCNSTYNTHDETRWYDHDSLIFLSGLCEPDAIMGNDDKFIDDVIRAAAACSPAFIALCNSPVPYLTGTDFAGISAVIEVRTGIPVFYVPTNGMHDYISGAGMAWERLARKWFGEDKNRPAHAGSCPGAPKVSVLGMTPLDFAAAGCGDALQKVLREGGFAAGPVWAMGSSLREIEKTPSADVNLVVSASGLPLAKYLHSRFGTPWTAGLPLPGHTGGVFRSLEEAVDSGSCGCAYMRDLPEGSCACTAPEVIVIGEPVSACSIAYVCESKGLTTRVIAATEGSEDLIRPGDLVCRGEEETENALSGLCRPGTRVLADPMYERICPAGTDFIPIPHLAFSGRVYRSRFMNLFEAETARGIFG
jgi:nitrogenase molybdenum-iron protein alpha/beta subunit